jgi:hypothetical protein
VPKISTLQHWPSSKWVNQLYDYLPTLTLTVSVRKEKDRIYQDLHNQVDSLVLQRQVFAQRALLRGDTWPALESGLAIQEFVIAFVCRFQVILLHGYINFPTIDDLWQIILDRYLRIGLESGDRVPLLLQTVEEGSSWEGGGPIQLPYIPLDSIIADNYRWYQNSAGIETDSVRNPATQTCQAIQNSIRFRQLIWQGQWAVWRFGRYITDLDRCTKWLSRTSSTAITNA